MLVCILSVMDDLLVDVLTSGEQQPATISFDHWHHLEKQNRTYSFNLQSFIFFGVYVHWPVRHTLRLEFIDSFSYFNSVQD